MNDRDSEALLGLFIARGYKVADDPVKADVVLANTCSVRALAENKARSFLGEFQGANPGVNGDPGIKRKRIKSTEKKKVVGLIGCMARNEGKRLFQSMAYVDLICAPGALERIPGYVEQIMQANGDRSIFADKNGPAPKRKRIIDLEDRMRDESAYQAPYREKKNHANVVISTGCANSCSYCIVPYVRGSLRLRKPEDILNEVKRAVDGGAKKITLLGQNVNDYEYGVGAKPCFRPGDGGRLHGIAPTNFVDLLKMVSDIPGVEQIDFISSNPKNTSKELFELMASSTKIEKFINLPFQSGSNKILKAMNRGYTREDYLALIKQYRKIVKGGRVGTDVIVGFPGETDEDFADTLDMMKRVKFNVAFIFKYSPRPHSAAFAIVDDVPKNVKEARHQKLLDLQKTFD